MTDPLKPSPADDDELQFDNAEYGAEAPAAMTCAGCSQPIEGAYYEANGKVVCETCGERLLDHRPAGSGIGRFVRAVFFGGLAALAGFAIYLTVAKMTGKEWVLISILVGFMVGSGVRTGSRQRGGLLYQFLAIFLTYTAVALTYSTMLMPQLVAEFKKAAEQDAHEEAQEKAAVALAAKPPGAQGKGKPTAVDGHDHARPDETAQPAADAEGQARKNPPASPADADKAAKPDADAKRADADDAARVIAAREPDAAAKNAKGNAADKAVAAPKPGADAEDADADNAGKRDAAAENVGPGALILALAVVFAFGVFLLYALPIYAYLQSPIGFLFLAVAFWQAWALNKRVPLVVNGPYEAGIAKPSVAEYDEHA